MNEIFTGLTNFFLSTADALYFICICEIALITCLYNVLVPCSRSFYSQCNTDDFDSWLVHLVFKLCLFHFSKLILQFFQFLKFVIVVVMMFPLCLGLSLENGTCSSSERFVSPVFIYSGCVRELLRVQVRLDNRIVCTIFLFIQDCDCLLCSSDHY